MFTLIPYFSNFLCTVPLFHDTYYHPEGHCSKTVNTSLITAAAAAAAAAAAKSPQSFLTLCDLTDGSPLGSPVPGILQARTLEWVAISFSSA